MYILYAYYVFYIVEKRLGFEWGSIKMNIKDLYIFLFLKYKYFSTLDAINMYMFRHISNVQKRMCKHYAPMYANEITVNY